MAEGSLTVGDPNNTQTYDTEYLGLTLDNYATTTMYGADFVYAFSGSVIENEPGATFDVQCDAPGFSGLIADGKLVGPAVFNNLTGATFIADGTDARAILSFNNEGTVEVETGLFQFHNIFGSTDTNSGIIVGEPGTRLQFFGPQEMTSTSVLSGYDVQFMGDGPDDADIGGSYAASDATVVIGQQVNFTGEVTVLGHGPGLKVGE